MPRSLSRLLTVLSISSVILWMSSGSPAYGARPLRRTIQRAVEDALSEEIIAGHIALGDDVRLYVNGDHKIGFEKMVQPKNAVFPAVTE